MSDDNVNATVTDVGAVALAAKEVASAVKEVVKQRGAIEAKATLKHFYKFLEAARNERVREDKDLNRIATYFENERVFIREFIEAFTKEKP